MIRYPPRSSPVTGPARVPLMSYRTVATTPEFSHYWAKARCRTGICWDQVHTASSGLFLNLPLGFCLGDVFHTAHATETLLSELQSWPLGDLVVALVFLIPFVFPYSFLFCSPGLSHVHSLPAVAS